MRGSKSSRSPACQQPVGAVGSCQGRTNGQPKATSKWFPSTTSLSSWHPSLSLRLWFSSSSMSWVSQLAGVLSEAQLGAQGGHTELISLEILRSGDLVPGASHVENPAESSAGLGCLGRQTAEGLDSPFWGGELGFTRAHRRCIAREQLQQTPVFPFCNCWGHLGSLHRLGMASGSHVLQFQASMPPFGVRGRRST